MSGLEARALGKSFGEGERRVDVLEGLDLSIKEGEFVAITGKSGSGKSTLLHILGCLDRPSSGEYLLRGRDVAGLDDRGLSRVRAAEIGFVFQRFHLLPQLSVRDNVAVPFLYAENPPRDPFVKVTQALEQVGLSHRADHKPATLSGGEAQRVAIARALVNEPLVLLADEPTGNLDHATGSGVLELLETIHKSGRTVVIVTHDPNVAARAQRVFHLKEGRFEA